MPTYFLVLLYFLECVTYNGEYYTHLITLFYKKMRIPFQGEWKSARS